MEETRNSFKEILCICSECLLCSVLSNQQTISTKDSNVKLCYQIKIVESDNMSVCMFMFYHNLSVARQLTLTHVIHLGERIGYAQKVSQKM